MADTANSSSSVTAPRGGGGSACSRVLYIQMEYCYATLQEAIQGGQLWRSEVEVGRLFLQLLDAVQYVHSMRVMHRDLKVQDDADASDGQLTDPNQVLYIYCNSLPISS